MPHYQNSVIYKICHCNDLENENIYIGSTTNFTRRKYEHKNRCNNEKNTEYNLPVYQFIRDNGGWEQFLMIPIEVYPCNDKKELEVRERYHIELLKSKLNKQKPTRSKKEWAIDNKEIIAEQKKQHYEDNKKQILEKSKQYYEDNKEKIKEKTKKYQEQNKEYKKEKDKEYYQNHKEQIAEKTKEKVICDHCGCEITKVYLKKHKKTKKCLEKQKI